MHGHRRRGGAPPLQAGGTQHSLHQRDEQPVGRLRLRRTPRHAAHEGRGHPGLDRPRSARQGLPRPGLRAREHRRRRRRPPAGTHQPQARHPHHHPRRAPRPRQQPLPPDQVGALRF